MASNIQAVLLDLYGTLAYIPTDAYIQTKCRMADVIGCDGSIFMNVWRSFTGLSTKGEIYSTEERVEATLSKMGLKTSNTMIQQMAAMEVALQENEVRLLPSAIEILFEIKNMQLKTALVTNCSSSTLNVPDKLGLTSFFDAIILSFSEGVIKPDPQIYKNACSKIKIQPKFCVFAGDGDCNELDGAKSLGITTILVQGTEDIALHVGDSHSADYSVQAISELPSLLRELSAN